MGFSAKLVFVFKVCTSKIVQSLFMTGCITVCTDVYIILNENIPIIT